MRVMALFSTSFFAEYLRVVEDGSFLPSSGRGHKMTHKGWGVVRPQLSQSISQKMQIFFLFLQENIMQ